MGQEYTTAQLLLAFSRELNGTRGKNRNYSTRPITVRGTTFSYYFTKEDVVKILKSEGTIQIGLIDSLYRFEDDLEKYIRAATEDTQELFYTDWIKQNNLKIAIKKGDIFRC